MNKISRNQSVPKRFRHDFVVVTRRFVAEQLCSAFEGNAQQFRSDSALHNDCAVISQRFRTDYALVAEIFRGDFAKISQ
jgi:hypothetical protein